MKKFLPIATGLVLAILATPSSIFSQCVSGLPMSITYDSIVTGTGNSSRTFTFPKFDPSLGTFLSVDLKSVVKVSYSYTLTNTSTIAPNTIKTRIFRSDDIDSPAFDGSPISAANQSPQVTTLLLPTQQSTYGPAKMNYTVSNTITDGTLVNFEGAGNVSFDYQTGTSLSVSASAGGSVIFNFNSVYDTTTFSITYKYCPNALLASGMQFVSAAAQADNKVVLNWKQPVVEAGRTYTLQVSTNGVHFTAFAEQTEDNTGNYFYGYQGDAAAKKLYFRILEKNKDGSLKYSIVRVVELSGKPGTAHVYPSLYKGGPMQINFPARGDWRVRMFASDGKQVFDNREINAYNALVQIPGTLGNGVYIVEAFDLHSFQHQIDRIIIQR